MLTSSGGRIVTVALAALLVSAAEVAVTVTAAGFGTVPGALYRPVELTTPHAAPEHPLPVTLQVTAVFEFPVTFALNCSCSPATTCAVVGEIVTATGGMMVTVAVAEEVASATDVTFTVTCGGLGTLEGAVYSPVEVIFPHALPLHPLPLTLQVTLVLAVPVTVATKCACAPVVSVSVTGEIVTAIGGTSVTEAVLDFVGSAAAVAVTKTWAGFGTTNGAVYSPVEETAPQEAPLQPGPVTLQFTAVFVVPVTVALNCCVLLSVTCTLAGEMLTATGPVIVTRALPDLLVSATEVAVTVTWFGLGAVAGAVYSPLLLIVPHAAPLHPLPATVQVTAVLVVF